MRTAASFCGCKVGHKADNSPPFIDKKKNMWIYISSNEMLISIVLINNRKDINIYRIDLVNCYIMCYVKYHT
jgi:hypothetical protein